MNDNIHYKNNFRWYSITKLNVSIDPNILNELIAIWKNIDWGENYQNYRRPAYQGAIYPCTRVKSWFYNSKDDDYGIKIRAVNKKIIEQISSFFNFEIQIFQTEMTLLVPEGKVPWHHDRMKHTQVNSRLMIPLLNADNIKYSFSSWREDTPLVLSQFPGVHYLDSDIYECEMPVGGFYLFNHRVPHKTHSFNKLPRAMCSIDFSNYICNDTTFEPISKNERTKIIPPIL